MNCPYCGTKVTKPEVKMSCVLCEKCRYVLPYKEITEWLKAKEKKENEV